MKKTYFALFLSVIFLACGRVDTRPEPVSLICDDAMLADAKAAVEAGDPAALEAFGALLARADSLCLTMEPLSVTMKKQIPPSGDPRDYMTLSPYWWPDPSDPSAPYIRRDGERNPQVYDYPEREGSGRLGEAVQMLGIVYHVTGEEKYAAKASELLRAWFTDPVTGMNPNMTFGQIRPGHRSIRGTGIIDARRFTFALEGAKMIEDSQSWTAADKKALQAWSGAFVYWLENSTQGRMEMAAPNNHGLWYDVIRLVHLLYAGDYDHALEVVRDSYAARLDSQVAADGSLPHELARTLGLHYSTFATEASLIAANMGRKVGYDLWKHTTPDGQSLSGMVEFLYPYYTGEQIWPFMQISPFNNGRASVVLYESGIRTGEQKYIDAAFKIGYGSGYYPVLRLVNYKLGWEQPQE